MDEDERMMRGVLRLARKGMGSVSPNPLVGAIVTRRGKIVGSGYHQKAGGPHAEVIALQKAGDKARGGTLYLNLEPCCHTAKRTPPCTEAILKSGIKKVVVAMADPNPEVNGKGMAILKKEGIGVKSGILNQEAEILNEVFSRHITTGLPFAALKIAATLDGKIATASGLSRWITGEKAREAVHRLRNQYDAILVGKGTVMADDPELTVRLPQKSNRRPVRIIVDSDLAASPQSRVFHLREGERVIVATTRRAEDSRKKKMEERGVEVLRIEEKEGRVSLPSLFRRLAKMGMTSVLIEGGGRINASLLNEGLVDKIYYFIALKLMGGEDSLSAIGGASPASLSSLPHLKKTKITRVGEDILVEGYLR
ncbi:MAG: bifunctional diaminohydroxyphosphoribosylaminopyrimidine deaminase/5-amino-6-(5-phosphoribosylamino)uracil reductase RibD [Nitrospirae bacterium]|nr:bifunctional diaminohydroxyphosphoribosylaminopyrimidine deaminase/5-amino-6-(5-phosphoribosylamino)uracil reductase RibD [Nitrospirota bacterium]